MNAQSPAPVEPAAPAADRCDLPNALEYLADVIHELHAMADRTPCRTLTGLLQVAHQEALLRRDEAAKTGPDCQANQR